MQIRLRVNRIQIDAQRVVASYDRAERRVLSRAAGLARTYARRRMRKRSRPSRPGEGPTEVKGQLKRFLLWAYEPANGVAVVGPQKLGGATGDTPEALEKGLSTVRRVGRGRQSRRVKYEKRPSTVPALETVTPGLPAMWSGAIRR